MYVDTYLRVNRSNYLSMILVHRWSLLGIGFLTNLYLEIYSKNTKIFVWEVFVQIP